NHGPALQLGDRLVLLNPHDVANRVFVGLVMRVVLLRPTDGLLHRRMREAPLDAHDNRLVLLVADDDALERSLRHKRPLTSPSAWPRPHLSRLPSPAAHRRQNASARRWSSAARCRGG